MFLLKTKAPNNLADMTYYVETKSYDTAYRLAHEKQLKELAVAADKFNSTTKELLSYFKGAAICEINTIVDKS